MLRTAVPARQVRLARQPLLRGTVIPQCRAQFRAGIGGKSRCRADQQEDTEDRVKSELLHRTTVSQKNSSPVGAACSRIVAEPMAGANLSVNEVKLRQWS